MQIIFALITTVVGTAVESGFPLRRIEAMSDLSSSDDSDEHVELRSPVSPGLRLNKRQKTVSFADRIESPFGFFAELRSSPVKAILPAEEGGYPLTARLGSFRENVAEFIAVDELLFARWRDAVLKNAFPEVYEGTDPANNDFQDVLTLVDSFMFVSSVRELIHASQGDENDRENVAIARCLFVLHICNDLGILEPVLDALSHSAPHPTPFDESDEEEERFASTFATQFTLQGGLALDLIMQISIDEGIPKDQLLNLVASIAFQNHLSWTLGYSEHVDQGW